MAKKRDLIIGCLLLVFDLVYFILSFSISPHRGIGSTPMDNRVVPRIYSALLLSLAVLLIVRGLKREKDSSEKIVKDLITEYKPVILSFLFLIMYILLLNSVGFVIMTVIFLFSLFIILRPKGNKPKYHTAFLISILTSLIIFFFFGKTLHVMLPTGTLFQ